MTLALQNYTQPELLEVFGQAVVSLPGKTDSVTTENAASPRNSALSSAPGALFLYDVGHGWFVASSSVSDRRQMQMRGTLPNAHRSNDLLAGRLRESHWDASAVFAFEGRNVNPSATAWVDDAQIQRSYYQDWATFVEQITSEPAIARDDFTFWGKNSSPSVVVRVDDAQIQRSYSHLWAAFVERVASEPTISPHVEISTYDALLNDMLADLRGARDEAAEEGFPPPSDIAITRAERLLIKTRRFSSLQFDVYPTPDGEIAIDMHVDGGSVLLLCDSDGGALCLVNMNGDKRRKRYDSASELPDGFLIQAMSELNHGAVS